MATEIDPSTVLEDTVLPAGGRWGRQLNKGQRLRFIDIEGKQAIDFLCYAADDPKDRYNAANTMKLNGNLFLNQGSSLWSVKVNKMMTILEDTCGSHDTIGGCCSVEINEHRYGVKNSPNCQENFQRILANFGMDERDIVANVNFFMYVPVDAKGQMEIKESLSEPGSYVDLVAEMNLVAVCSNCPQENNPAAGFNPTPVRVIVYETA
jgi:urea carboxylase-associated protein 1